MEVERKLAFCSNCEKKFQNQQYVYSDLDGFYFCSPNCILKFIGMKQERINIINKNKQKVEMK